MRRIVQIASCLLVLQGILLGMLIIAVAVGDPVLRTPLARVLTAVVAGLAPIVASLVSTHNFRLAGRINLWVAPLAFILVVPLSWELGGILQGMAVFSGAILVPGFFWLLAARRNWTPPSRTYFVSRNHVAAMVLSSGLLIVLAAVAFSWSLGFPWWPPVGDCLGRPLLDETGLARNLDFTARIVFVGPRTYRGYSLWAIARIEERFSVAHLERGDIVILRGGFQPTDKSQLYFVEGRRGFSSSLPVILPVECGHTGPRDFEAVAIRILRGGPPKSGAHLIGRVLKGEYRSNWALQRPVPGTEVSVEGTAGRIVSTTDAEGIYSVDGLPPGRYTIQVATGEVHGRTSRGGEIGAVDLRIGETGGEDFYVK